jgi:hypothetical protein
LLQAKANSYLLIAPGKSKFLSFFEQAVSLNQWDKLLACLADGRLEINRETAKEHGIALSLPDVFA